MTNLEPMESILAKSEGIRKETAALKAERIAWDAYLDEARSQIVALRTVLKQFHKVIEDNQKIMESFMAEVDNIKKLKKLTDLTEKIVEEMQK